MLEDERECSGVTPYAATSDANARNFGSGASSCCGANFVKMYILFLSSNHAARCVQALGEGQTVSVLLGPASSAITLQPGRVMPSFQVWDPLFFEDALSQCGRAEAPLV